MLKGRGVGICAWGLRGRKWGWVGVGCVPCAYIDEKWNWAWWLRGDGLAARGFGGLCRCSGCVSWQNDLLLYRLFCIPLMRIMNTEVLDGISVSLFHNT